MSERLTYSIKFGLFFKNGKSQVKIYNVKNCMSELHAKIKLNEYMKKTHPNFDHIEVYSCVVDWIGSVFGRF